METALLILALLIMIASALGLFAIIVATLTWKMWLPNVPQAISPVTSVEEGTAKCIMLNGRVRRFITSRPKTDPVPDPESLDPVHPQSNVTRINTDSDLWTTEGELEPE